MILLVKRAESTGKDIVLVMSDYITEKIMGDGRLGVVMPLTFGRARIGISPANMGWFDNEW